MNLAFLSDITHLIVGYAVLFSPLIYGYLLKKELDELEEIEENEKLSCNESVQWLSRSHVTSLFERYPALAASHEWTDNSLETLRRTTQAKLLEQSDREFEYLDEYFSSRYPSNYKGCVVNDKFSPRVYIVSMSLPLSPFIAINDIATDTRTKRHLAYIKRKNRKCFELMARFSIVRQFEQDCIFNDRVVVHFSQPAKRTNGGVSYTL